MGKYSETAVLSIVLVLVQSQSIVGAWIGAVFYVIRIVSVQVVAKLELVVEVDSIQREMRIPT